METLTQTIKKFPVGIELGLFSLDKSQLSYKISWPNGTVLSRDDSTELNFHPKSDIKVFKFEESTTPLGTLHMSVFYDSFVFRQGVFNTKLNSMMESMSIEKFNPPKRLDSSPFPSPKLQKKVLAIANSSLDRKYQSSNIKYSTTSDMDRKNSKRLLQIKANINSQNRHGTAMRDELEIPMSFIGSYEESLFLGRLSTSPSKPITFVCDIGVLATGKCRPSLKCPPHLILNFSAYYYQLSDEDQPTPYVGTIQLTVPELTDGYRIPLKGQLQIV